MSKLNVIGKNIHLDVGEQEMLKHMMAGAGLTEQEALNEVMGYKREQAVLHDQLGNFALAKHLLQSIDEWDDSREEAYKNGETIFHVNRDREIIINTP